MKQLREEKHKLFQGVDIEMKFVKGEGKKNDGPNVSNQYPAALSGPRKIAHEERVRFVLEYMPNLPEVFE